MILIKEKDKAPIKLFVEVRGKNTEFPYVKGYSEDGEKVRLPVFRDNKEFKLTFSFDPFTLYRPYKPNGDNTIKTLLLPNSWDDKQVLGFLRKYRCTGTIQKVSIPTDTGVDYVLNNLVTVIPDNSEV